MTTGHTPSGGTGEAKRDAQAAAEGVRREAEGLAGEAKQAAAAVGRDARRAAADAQQAARDYAERQKDEVAGRTAGMAAALNAAADSLRDRGEGRLAGYAVEAAHGVERAAEALRERRIEDIVQEVVGFAHRQPAAFVGGAVLAGFVLSRFLKSSAERSAERSHDGDRPDAAASGYPSHAMPQAPADVTPAGGTL